MIDQDQPPTPTETVASVPLVVTESLRESTEQENNFISLNDEVLLSRSLYEVLENKANFQISETSTLGNAIGEVSIKTKDRPGLEHGCAVYTRLITDWRGQEPRLLEITNISTGDTAEVNIDKQKPTDHFEIMIHSHPVDSSSSLFSPFDVQVTIRESSQASILMLQSSDGDSVTLMMINPLHSNFNRELRRDITDGLAKIDESRSKEIMEVINQGFVDGKPGGETEDEMKQSVDKLFDISVDYEKKMFEYLVSKGFLFYKSYDNSNFEKVNDINIPNENS